MKEAWIRCRRCMPDGQTREEFFRDLARYVERIPAEERVDETEYWRRLDKCRSCDQLWQGMCRQCGCYVELRAALKVRRCPMTVPKWNAAASADPPCQET